MAKKMDMTEEKQKAFKIYLKALGILNKKKSVMRSLIIKDARKVTKAMREEIESLENKVKTLLENVDSIA